MMIYVSLIEYLKTGQLGHFAPLSPQSCVLETLGPPPFWDGWGTTACERSTSWVYDSIQFNFDDDFRLTDTHIAFDRKFSNDSVNYSDWTNRFVQLGDLDIDAICTPEAFVATMNQNHILTTRKMSHSGLVIRTEVGVEARFCQITDWDASKECEKPIQTDRRYLHRITTVKTA